MFEVLFDFIYCVRFAEKINPKVAKVILVDLFTELE